MEPDCTHGNNLWLKAILAELNSIDEYGTFCNMGIGPNQKDKRIFAIILCMLSNVIYIARPGYSLMVFLQ